jgi:exodeoxyribonuclease V gamma subunit
VLRFGQAEEHAKVDQLLPPIELEVDVPTRDGVRKQKVQLHGRTDPVLANRPGSLILDWRAPKKDWSEEIRRSRKHLRAFLDHVVLTASGVAPEDDYRSCLVIAGEGVTSAVKPLPRLGRLPATEYLRTVVSDLLSQVHAYLLPCEAVFKASVVERDHDFARAVDAVFSGRTITPSSAYGPVPNPAEYPSLPNHEAARIVARRFGLFLAAVAPPEA